jgi:CO/xanthine dehydrogenase Mo-binding subunit
MLMAAADLLLRVDQPSRQQVLDAIGGVLCRCTGYQKIVEAILAASESAAVAIPSAGSAVGARIERIDAPDKLDGSAIFGSDSAPEGALAMRVLRSPHAHARVQIGNMDAWVAKTPGVAGYIVAEDIPNNLFAIFPDLRDQPALAEGTARFLGEAVLAVVGDAEVIEALDLNTIPITFEALPPQLSVADSTAEDAVVIQARYPDNILCRGHVASGDLTIAHRATFRIRGQMQTAHVEHAYIEPEAGYAVWDASGPHTVTLFVTTQTPYLDRDEIAWMFNLDPTQVRIVPTAVGGGFGGKLDLSVQPLLVAAARKFGQAVRTTFERPESMRSSTKRHPAQMSAELFADKDGTFIAYDFQGDFNTGPYASWGPTVANRVPIHASGPYRYQAVRAKTRAVLTHNANGGAFRGFGVPQSTLLAETLIDELADQLGKDPLQLRLHNAMRAGDSTPCGQRLDASVGMVRCLEVLQPAWQARRQAAMDFNALAKQAADDPDARVAPKGWPDAQCVASSGTDPHGLSFATKRRGVGVASMWYGIGNTVMANPSEMTVGLRPDGRLMLYNGAVDIGQGTYTIMPQICADAVGLPVHLFDQVFADTALTADAGKSSASRQTFVSGNAAMLAGEQLRQRLCALLSVPLQTEVTLDGHRLCAPGMDPIDLRKLPTDERGDVATGTGYFNPPTVPLDANGQGVPYATYGFAAQLAEVEVDIELGTVRVLSIHAAHDVGRAINPTQVEGQIHGGIAQGLGLALMEEYVAGKTDNLHDYLIPTAGDMPEITTHLVEDPEPLGPFGAKGVGEPALVATAPAILNAIRDACGACLDQVPVTPDRLRDAIAQQVDSAQ